MKAVKKRAFSEALKIAREARRLTQAEMADKIDVSSRFYQSLEGGAKEPSYTTVEKALERLEMGYDDFFGVQAKRSNRPTSPALKALIEAPAENVALGPSLMFLQEFVQAAPEVRAAVLAVLYGDSSIAAPYVQKKRKVQGS